MGSCRRFRSSSFTSLSFARMRSPRHCLRSWKKPLRVFPQMWVNPRKLKVWFANTFLLASLGRVASELNQSGLVRMQRKRELPEPRAHRIEKAARVACPLEADYDIVRVADDYHVAGGLAPSPALGPQVQDVMEIDVGQKR